MDFSDMQTWVRRHLGQTDTTNTYFTDTEVQESINEALIQVAKDTRSLLTFHQKATVDAQQRYTLPAEFLQLVGVEIDISATRRDPLEGLSFAEFMDETYHDYVRPGIPEFYKLEYGATDTTNARPGDIWLWPVPDTTAWTLRIYTIQKPQTLTTGTDVSEVPTEAHMAATFYAAMILSLKDSDLARHDRLQLHYRNAISQYEVVDFRRDKSRVRKIRSRQRQRHRRRYYGERA